MAYDYSPAAASATRALEKYGALCQHKRTNRVDASVTVTAVKILFAETVMSTVAAVQDNGVKNGDFKTLWNNAVLPVKGDIVDKGAERYSVIFVDPVQPGGSPVVTFVYLRRG